VHLGCDSFATHGRRHLRGTAGQGTQRFAVDTPSFS
jgi:hypothetical protein